VSLVAGLPPVAAAAGQLPVATATGETAASAGVIAAMTPGDDEN
jgi:hypothetical protein